MIRYQELLLKINFKCQTLFLIEPKKNLNFCESINRIKQKS